MLSQFVFVLKIKIKWSLWPFPLHEISVLIETILGHLRYLLTDVPPQPNSPPDTVSGPGRARAHPPSRASAHARLALQKSARGRASSPHRRISKAASIVVVFHGWLAPPTYSTPTKPPHRVGLE